MSCSVRSFNASAQSSQSRPFPVADFVLFQSFLGQAGAIHQPEVTFPLDGDSI